MAGYLAEAGALGHSLVATDGDRFAAALRASLEGDRGGFIAYVMTAADWTGRGCARYLVDLSLRSMADAGLTGVSAWITEGNTRPEAIFDAAGFEFTDTVSASTDGREAGRCA